MATHSRILAPRIPCTEKKPGRLQSMGSQSPTRLSDCHTQSVNKIQLCFVQRRLRVLKGGWGNREGSEQGHWRTREVKIRNTGKAWFVQVKPTWFVNDTMYRSAAPPLPQRLGTETLSSGVDETNSKFFPQPYLFSGSPLKALGSYKGWDLELVETMLAFCSCLIFQIFFYVNHF